MIRRVLLVLAAVALPASAVLGHEASHGAHQSQSRADLPVTLVKAELAIPETPVVDQDGAPHTFKEVLGDGIFVISFTYTNCEALCGIADLTMMALDESRAAVDAPFRLITLTLDPVRDTPAILKERHEAFGSPDAWWRLTGRPSEIQPLLRRLGAWDGGPLDEHKLVYMIGDSSSGEVTRLETEAQGVSERLLAITASYAAR